MSQDWIGKTIGGRYRVKSLLGRGGMSSVYRAEDPNLKRPVAVKLIHPHLSEDSNFVGRFKEEAAAVARLRHPNIVQVHDFDADGDLYYMVMEYLVGETLQARLRRVNAANRFMPIQEVLALAIQVCEAAAYAHHHDLIHRDIKPANIMLTVEDQAVLMDFGIVKIIGGDHHTATGATVGTAMYMSPEQIRTERVDARADIYSLGVTLYEMLSGNPPYTADSAVTLMMMVLNDPLPDLREVRSGVPDQLCRVVEKSLAKDVEGRYQRMEDMRADLRQAQEAHSASPPVLAATLVDEKPTGTSQPPPSVESAEGVEEPKLLSHEDPFASVKKEADRAGFSAAETITDSAAVPRHPDAAIPEAAEVPRQPDAATPEAIEVPRAPAAAAPEQSSAARILRPTRPVSRRILLPVGLAAAALVITLSLLIFTGRQPPHPRLMPIGLPADVITAQTAGLVVHLGTWETDSYVEDLAMSPDGTLLATASNRERFRFAQQRYYAGIWQIKPGALEHYLTGHALWVYDIVFSPDGEYLGTVSDDGFVRIWRVTDGQHVKSLAYEESGLSSLDYAPDGLLLASGGWDGSVLIWDVAAEVSLRSLQVDDFSIEDVIFSPDGMLIAAASESGNVYIWNVRDGSLLYTLPAQNGPVHQVVFSPDGSSIAAASGDRGVSLWTMRDGSLTMTLEGHPEPVRAVAFSPDGSTLISGSEDGALRLWRAGDGALLATLQGNPESVLGLAFSRDSALLVSATEDGMVQFWGISAAIQPGSE